MEVPREGSPRRLRRLPRCLLQHWPLLTTVIAGSALTLCAAFWIESDPLKCIFFLLLLSVLLTTNVFPATVAALFPIFILPILGLATTQDVSKMYSEVPQFSFISIMFVVVASMECGLYKRLALLLLSKIGSSVKALLVSVIVPSVCVSFLLGSYLCTLLLWPIVTCVTDQLFLEYLADDDDLGNGGAVKPVGKKLPIFTPGIVRPIFLEDIDVTDEDFNGIKGQDEDQDRKQITLEKDQLQHTLLLGLVYGTSIGCTSAPHGSLPNRRLFHFLDSYYRQHPLTYITWFAYSLPTLLLCTVILWLYLLGRGIPDRLRGQDAEECRRIYGNRYTCLGSLGFNETAVAVMQVCVLVCNIIFHSWLGDLHEHRSLARTSVLTALGSLVFILPESPLEGLDSPPMLSWSVFCSHMPWGCLFLCGAGMAVASVIMTSGTSKATFSLILRDMRAPAAPSMIVLCFLVATITELKSFRRREEGLLIPMLNQLALERQTNPLLFLIPAVRLSCVAIMLPVANYPNALLYECAHLSPWKLIKAGLLMKITFVGIEIISLLTLGYVLFDLGSFPSWAADSTNTSSVDYEHTSMT